VVLDGAPPVLRVSPDNTAPVTAELVGFDRRSRRVSALVSVGANPSDAVRVGASFAELVEVAVLNRALGRGEIVQTADFTIERRPKETLPGDIQPDVAQLAARVARRSIAAGSVLRVGDVGKPEIVARGDIVTVVYEIPGMVLTLRGRAIEAGAQGDTIGVLNIQSKRALQATITGPGKVSVAAPVPGRLAANTAAQTPNP
jgi:flagellar basal body P-ring formation protein FlgA